MGEEGLSEDYKGGGDLGSVVATEGAGGAPARTVPVLSAVAMGAGRACLLLVEMGNALEALSHSVRAQSASSFGVHQCEWHVGGAAAVVAGVGGDVADIMCVTDRPGWGLRVCMQVLHVRFKLSKFGSAKKYRQKERSISGTRRLRGTSRDLASRFRYLSDRGRVSP